MSPVLVLYHRNIEQKRYIVNLTESVYLEMKGWTGFFVSV